MTNRPHDSASRRIRLAGRSTRCRRGRRRRRRQALDAYRQTQFVLGDDLDLFAEAMNLQLALVAKQTPSTSSQYRTHGARRDHRRSGRAPTCTLARRAAAGVARLLRFDAAPGARRLRAHRGGGRAARRRDGRAPRWLASTLQPDETHKAFEFELGRYFAGEVLASDDVCAPSTARPATSGGPTFGATLLQVGPESNNTRSRSTSPTRPSTWAGRRSRSAGCWRSRRGRSSVVMDA